MGDDRKMNNEPLEREPVNNEPLEREPIDRVRARLEALLKANAAPRCGARSKRTGKPCRAAAMPNGRCKVQQIMLLRQAREARLLRHTASGVREGGCPAVAVELGDLGSCRAGRA